MKRISVLSVELLLCVAAWAQRDFDLVKNQNFWLTASNAAALTTFSAKSISEGSVGYRYESGAFLAVVSGKSSSSFGADVSSYMRLTERLVVSGNISYANRLASECAGSMLAESDILKPFDLVELTDENAGDKRLEIFNLVGAAGWRVIHGLSVGAVIDYKAGTYAKFRDLRHTNTLMNLDLRAGAFYSFGGRNGVGADFIYDRNTETVKFESFGTTDKVFKTVVDYANGFGPIETYGGEGFTDDSHEVPLFSECIGGGLQGGWNGIFADFSYLRRTGYYGRKSQYTVSHASFGSHIFRWHLRYALPGGSRSLCMFDLHYDSELLASYRTNYRRTVSQENASVAYYEYFEPTKMADKLCRKGDFAFTGYWKPAGEIFLWHARAGVEGMQLKQTAYMYPYIRTEKCLVLRPFVMGRRSIELPRKNLLSVEADCMLQLRQAEHLHTGLGVTYEQHLRTPAVRPYAKLWGELLSGTSSQTRGYLRSGITLSVGATF